MTVKMQEEVVSIRVWPATVASLDVMFMEFFIIEKRLSTNWALVVLVLGYLLPTRGQLGA